jgi:hypothetical protein
VAQQLAAAAFLGGLLSGGDSDACGSVTIENDACWCVNHLLMGRLSCLPVHRQLLRVMLNHVLHCNNRLLRYENHQDDHA